MKNSSGNWQRDYDGFYSEQILRIAAHRIRGLMEYNIIHNEPLERILRSAYLQGIVDAAESIKAKEAEKKDE